MEHIVRQFKYDIENFMHIKKLNNYAFVYVEKNLYNYIKNFHIATVIWLQEFRNIKLIEVENLKEYYIIDDNNIAFNTLEELMRDVKILIIKLNI